MLAVGDLDTAGDIDGLVERELDSFDQVEGNGVLQTASRFGSLAISLV